MNTLQAIILAIVEGITEFLPISSTGHMVITTALMGIKPDDFVKLFTVAIQFGAILSVVVLYWKRFFQSFDFYIKLIIAFIPAVIFGLLFKKKIDAALENVMFIAFNLFIGGIILLFVDKWFAKNEENGIESTEKVDYKKSFFTGCFQVIAMLMPGMSRSASTIVGGLTQGMTRKTASEFAFFLAVPTMAAATLKELWDNKTLLAEHHEYWSTLLIGNIVAFIVALLAIRFFVGFLQKNGFKMFGYYRIIVGGILLILIWMGYDLAIL